MKNFAVLLVLVVFAIPAFSGCSGGENSVIEAPETQTDETAMEGMSDEEYDAAMEADMNG